MGKTQLTGNLTNAISQDASNNVGIGAAPSGTYKLEVTGTAKVSSTLLVSGAATFSSSVTATQLNASISTSGAVGSVPNLAYFKNQGSGYVARMAIGDGTTSDSYISHTGGNTTATQYLGFGVNAYNQMVLTGAGNVGIGTDTPTDGKLVIAQSAVAATYKTDIALVSTNSVGTNSHGIDWFDRGIGGDNSGRISVIRESSSAVYAMAFYTANASFVATERMRITSGGFLKASNTGTYLSATGTYYEFNSDLNSIVQLWNITNASYADDVHQIRVTRAATSAYYFGSYYSGVTSDKEFGFRGDGVGYSDGGWTTPASDYAEYFESIDGTALPIGSTVSLVGNKIKIADDGETIIGVIRPKDAQLFLGNNASEKWNQKYLKNDYGSYLKDENDKRILNPNYDSTIEYIPRENRLEWNVIGLMGQIPIKKGQPTNPNWVKMKEISQEVELWLVK